MQPIDLPQLQSWDQQHVWHPFTPMQPYQQVEPTIIVRGDGFQLIDQRGKRYWDGFSSMWCNVHGHAVPELNEAIQVQLQQIAHSTLLGMGNEPSIRLARKLAELTRLQLPHVFFSDSGATAVEVALKLAFQYFRQRSNPNTCKRKYLAFHGAYHGDTLGDVSVGDIGRFHELFRPLLFETIRAPQPYCYRCPIGLERKSCGLRCIEMAEQLIEQHAHELVAVVIEPVLQAAAGVIPFPRGALRRLRDCCTANDVLLIADEVAVGIGRTGKMFACKHEQVVPDFLCLAKGISGGYLPLAATMTTSEIFKAFLGPPEAGKTFFHGHTYTGNPLAAAVSLANLELLETKQILTQLPDRIDQIATALQQLSDCPIVGEIRHCGMFVGVEIVQDRKTKQPFTRENPVANRICEHARQHGLWIRPLRDVVTLVPAVAIDEGTLNEMLNLFVQSIRTIAAECTPA